MGDREDRDHRGAQEVHHTDLPATERRPTEPRHTTTPTHATLLTTTTLPLATSATTVPQLTMVAVDHTTAAIMEPTIIITQAIATRLWALTIRGRPVMPC